MKNSPIYGVGINDVKELTQKSISENGKRKVIWTCPFYDRWRKMLQRCYSKKSLSRRRTYEGCSVSEEWLKFSAFKDWMKLQDWQGNHLDKDILVPGNKKYGSEFCVMVSPNLNKFLTDRASKRGEFPIGVSFHKATGKYQSNCNDPFTGRQIYLGLFECPNLAHKAWKAQKHKIACMYADTVSNKKLANALKIRYSDELEK